MTCSIIFWGNSYDSNKIFLLQKKFIGIVERDLQASDDCTLFSEVLPFILPWVKQVMEE
jgi:hypothetical protein